jgi:hypothetical protein
MLISAHRKLGNVAEAMSNNVPDVVRCFLDIKAQVDSEEDDDGSRDRPPGELTLVFSIVPLTSIRILDAFINDQDHKPLENMPRLLDSKLPD